jgi:hypothetical protein
MPIDLQSFTRTLNADVSVPNMPSITLRCVVKDSQTQAILLDLTTGNGLRFPQDIASYTTAERRDLLQHILEFMLRKRLADAGINT